ncbi:hypothetical protein BDW66DRAFT_53166 [Aspergillus desertorum]
MTQAVTCYNLVRLKLSEDGIIRIRGAGNSHARLVALTRSDSLSHLLQELTVSSYVPNDTLVRRQTGTRGRSQHVPEPPRIGSNQRMMLLTGPNYSGKSVYMKECIWHEQEGLSPQKALKLALPTRSWSNRIHKTVYLGSKALL